MPELVNLGSLCIDHVYAVPSIVRAGETLLGHDPVRHAGGKGLNQSLAAARAGASVVHVGCVGADGVWLKDALAQAGVDVDGVRVCESDPTGHAVIQVTPDGENAIVIVGGANRRIQPTDVERAIERVGADGWLLMQNEINDVEDVIEAARRANVRLALNIAPVDGREANYVLDGVELLLLNEIEAAALTRDADPKRAIERLACERPRQHVVVTLGMHGVLYACGDERITLPAFEVAAVDETAAGDAFIGHLMAAWIENLPIRERLRRASAAGALAVCVPGAAPAIPNAASVQQFLADYR
ncbi:MAG TPA: ribokinase [Pseudomonadales bacterium]|nr:ribokinase [Pseudomonadales bacterium]